MIRRQKSVFILSKMVCLFIFSGVDITRVLPSFVKSQFQGKIKYDLGVGNLYLSYAL